MAYVKNCNPGKIAMDLPWKNYIYELPLFSFGDLYGSLALSLVFNHSMKAEGYNPYFVAEGYKLNVHKRIVFEDNEPVAIEEANGNLVYLEGENDVYMLTDESQRVLRASGTTYILENPDFSYESYNSIGNIASSTDKYGSRILTYSYSTGNKLASIVYRNSKTITFTYSGTQLSKITYASNVITLAYASSSSSSHVVTVGHYSGETFTLSYTRSGSTAEPDVISTFCATENSSSNSVKAERENDSFVITELIGGTSVNRTTYNIHFGTGTTQNQVEITNNEGVKTRIQYDWKYPLCAYEINDDAEFFDDAGTLKNRFKGSVQMMSMQGLPTNNQSAGLQTAIDGTSFVSFDGNGQLDMDVSSNGSSSGYYIVSGWIKANTSVGNPITQVNIGVGTSTSALIHYPVDLTPIGQWKFFSCMVYAPANSIVVTTGDPNLNTEGGNIYTEDWRLSYLRTGTYVDKEPVYTNMKEYVLTNGTFEIPFREAKFKVFFSESEPSETTEITPMDVLKYKLTKKAHGTQSEAFYQNCKNVSCNATGISVLYNDNSYNIFSFDVAVKTYDKDNVYLKRIRLQESTSTANIIIQNYMNGAEKSVQTYNHYFDLISTTENGISKTFTRNARGLVKRESVGSLYSRSTAYGTDGTTVTVTDEYGDTTIYSLDSVWGVVKSITLPDGSVVTDTYDNDMCARIKRTFGSTSGRSNTFTYSGGNLSKLQTGDLYYNFGYSKDKLTGVQKNGTQVETHVHYTNRTDSYYPHGGDPLHAVQTYFDKYGRVTSVAGVLTNTYDLWPNFDTNTGALIPTVNNGSSLLAMTTDEIMSETIRYDYDEKGQMVEKTVTDKSNFQNKISKEQFTYDAIGRLTKHEAIYDAANSRSVEGQIIYKKTVSDPTADNRVGRYTYKVDGIQKVYTTNGFDTYNRPYRKESIFTSDPFVKLLTYDKTRVSQQADTFQNRNMGTNSYTYDAMGRMRSDNYACQYSASDYKTYQYDAYGQLIRENNQGLDKTFVYEYNSIGNLVCVKAYDYTLSDTPSGTPVTTTFGYTNDKLTTFGGSTIAYNSIGCPTTYDDMSATWTKGKLTRLGSGTLASGTKSYAYAYNAFGQRVSRSYTYAEGTSGLNQMQPGQVVGCNKQYFYDHSGRLIAENIFSTLYNAGSATERIVYLYDESTIIGMEYTTGGVATLYYFQRNLQGDVTAIYDTSGNLIAKYLYDAWGNCTISSETTNYAVANANPIRYRGYYFDDDTGLYYCNARYYSPKWRRFISPDDTAYLNPESVNGLNLYCYCNNDPVNYADASGHSADSIWKNILGIAVTIGIAAVAIGAIIVSGGTLLVPALVGAGIGAGLNLVGQVGANLYNGKNAFEDFNWGSFILAGVTGAAFATGAGGLVGAGFIGGFSNAGMSAFEGDSWGVIGFSAIVGFASGCAGFAMGQYISNKYLNINTNLGPGDYINMARVDGAGFWKRSVIALISKAYTMGSTMMKSGTRAIVKIAGNKIVSWIEDWLKG